MSIVIIVVTAVAAAALVGLLIAVAIAFGPAQRARALQKRIEAREAREYEVHEKLRLYVCPHCEHRAGSRGNLNVHVRAVHLKDRKILERRARYSATFAGEIFRLSILIRKTWDERLAQSGPALQPIKTNISSIVSHF